MKYFVNVGSREITVALTERGVEADGELVDALLTEVSGTPVVALRVGRQLFRLCVTRDAGRGEYLVITDAERFEVEAVDERTRAIRTLSSVQSARSGPSPLLAPMPGLVIRVDVQVGDKVDAGQGLIAMEAMKMENELRAPAPGTVKAVLVEPGDAVEKGTVLIELE
jgi:biotin carboxyl carrier protein